MTNTIKQFNEAKTNTRYQQEQQRNKRNSSNFKVITNEKTFELTKSSSKQFADHLPSPLQLYSELERWEKKYKMNDQDRWKQEQINEYERSIAMQQLLVLEDEIEQTNQIATAQQFLHKQKQNSNIQQLIQYELWE
ncbi:unnamed protein product [Rotaria socialis]|uniref:Uncharacterized protein n=1 Tax=Rotaria socialis TaxID=392032 RepID=A0A820XI53_9BILA|nr:unnamed protein product [Rotaria socialis]CAF4560037.1 unnamed protein product [Rotaria socialis]